MEFVAKTFHGLENVLANELSQLGALEVQVHTRAVSFSGDLRLLYRANFELRTALRILTPIHTFTARHENHFYKKIREFDWSRVMKLSDTFAIRATMHSEYFKHSKFMALKAKDGIVDQFREKFNARPSIDLQNPDYRFELHIQQDKCTMLLDSSGEALFKRGYRTAGLEAPINEVLAAGMILHTGWDGSVPLMDPMCGSGTIPIEAAMLAHQIPPQIIRTEFAFTKWSNFDRALWSAVREEASVKTKDVEAPIYASDISGRSVRFAQQNAQIAGVLNKITFEKKDFKNLEPVGSKGVVIMNPPYDERMKVDELHQLYAEMGSRFKHHFSGWDAWVISSNFEALKHIGLRPSKKMVLFNGALECKFQKFELFAGKRKENLNHER